MGLCCGKGLGHRGSTTIFSSLSFSFFLIFFEWKCGRGSPYNNFVFNTKDLKKIQKRLNKFKKTL
jgi:hypothetical protein